jgi:acyl dehydratase
MVGQDPLFWDDFCVGDAYRTAARTLTEADIVNFAGISGDFNSIHVDAVSAGSGPHKQRIAHGLLVLSIVSGLSTRLTMNQRLEPTLIGILNIECRFPKPTFIGDTLHAEISVADKIPTSRPARGILVFERLGVNQRQETVLHSRFTVMVGTRSGAATAVA